jgi:hypothetical protein
MITIKRVMNGWIMELIDEVGDEGYKPVQVFEIKDAYLEREEQREECASWAKLLWELTETIGPLYSKHRLVNVKVEVENNPDFLVEEAEIGTSGPTT